MFLDVEIPDDDPLRPAKMFVSTAAPGFRLFDKAGGVDWESDFIWLVIVNEEDGLDFRVRQTIDGKREIQSLWRDNELDDTSKLREYLREDPMWDVYQLRATVLLHSRVDAQINILKEFGDPGIDASVREGPWRLAERLRALELQMLERATETFESQVRKHPQTQGATQVANPTLSKSGGRLGLDLAWFRSSAEWKVIDTDTCYRRQASWSQSLFSSTWA